MKRILLALAASVSLLLTGCGFDSAACITAVSNVNKASFDATAKKAEAMLIALKGEDQLAKGMAMAWFMAQDAKMQAMGYGDCNRDSALEWARVLVNPLVNIWGITENARTARHSSDNNVKTQAITFGAIENISVKGMDEAGKVTIVPAAEPEPVADPAAAAGN